LYGLTFSIGDKDAKDATATVAYGDMSSEKVIAKPELKCTIYPNPVMDVVRITGFEGAYTVKMVDAVGQVVASAKGSSDELELDLGGKPAGMYLIKIESQGKSITRKIIKK
jgi:hypothetical protein